MKRNIILAIALILFTGFCASLLIQRDKTDKVRDIQIEAKTVDLKKLQLDTKALQLKYDTELEQQQVNQERVNQLEEERKKLQEQLDQAERDLQAKAEAKRIAQEKQNQVARTALNAVTGTKTASAQASGFGGSCEAWIAAAGITEVASARELIRRESGCNPNAVNRSSGACGVAQELDCGKSGCSTPPNGDGACQVAWMHRYVLSRYGSWGAAIAFHDRNDWY